MQQKADKNAKAWPISNLLGTGEVLIFGGLLAAAALFWLAFLAQSADSPLTRVPLLDEAWYLNDAARLRGEGWPGSQPFVMSAGYTSLVALSGAPAPGADGVLSGAPVGLLGLQILLWFVCGLGPAFAVWRLALKGGVAPRGARLAATVSALLVLLHAPAAVFARTTLLDLPLAGLVALALTLVAGTPEVGRRRLLIAALVLGLAALLRGHVLVVGVILLPLAWRRLAGVPRRVPVMAAMAALLLAPVSLAAAHNTHLVGRPAGPSLNLGVNLYLGQLPASGGFFTALAGFDQARDPSGEVFLEHRLGRDLAGPAAADRAWLAEAGRLLRDRPWHALGGWLRKAWLHLQAWEIPQVTPLQHWSREAPALRVLAVPWAVLVVAGLAGLGVVLAGRGRVAAALRGPVLVWALAGGVLVAAQSWFFVVSRYRLVLLPVLALLAGAGLVVLLAERGRVRAGVVAPVVVGALLLVQPWGLDEARNLWQGLESHNAARRLLVMADAAEGEESARQLRERAEPLLAVASGAAPRRVEPWRDRALNLAELGRLDAALAVLADGTTRADDPAPLQWLRIGLVRQSGQLDAAEALMQAYLREHPDDPDMLHDLAVLQGQRGRWRSAAATARRLREAVPGDARGWLDLAVAQSRLGRSAAAVATLEAGLAAVDDEAGRTLLRVNLARLGGDGP